MRKDSELDADLKKKRTEDRNHAERKFKEFDDDLIKENGTDDFYRDR